MVISFKCSNQDFDWKTNKIKLLTCIELFNDNSLLLQTKDKILNILQNIKMTNYWTDLN